MGIFPISGFSIAVGDEVHLLNNQNAIPMTGMSNMLVNESKRLPINDLKILVSLKNSYETPAIPNRINTNSTIDLMRWIWLVGFNFLFLAYLFGSMSIPYYANMSCLLILI
jgi:hypothetical protein